MYIAVLDKDQNGLFQAVSHAGLDFLLTPEQIHLKTKSTVFVDLWAGSYNTVAQTEKVSHWGRNCFE
jgi:hypothetical protein